MSSKALDKTIYVRNLPPQASRRTLTNAVKKFGNIKHKNIKIRTIGDGYRYAFMQFNSQDTAKQVVEVGFIQFDEWQCQVEYKKGDTKGQDGCGTGNGGGNVRNN